jgi:hypothetical protein
VRSAGRNGVFTAWLRGPGGSAGRLAVVMALLVLAGLGARAREVTRLSTAGMVRASAGPVMTVFGVLLVAAACLVLAGVVVLLAGHRRRRDNGEPRRVPVPVGTRWQRALALLSVLTMLALPVAAVVVAVRSQHGGARAVLHPAPVVSVVPHVRSPEPVPGGTTGAALLAVALAVVTAVAAIALWRGQRRRAPAAQQGPGAKASPLAAAVAAGSWALEHSPGAREAIIACYAAMEEALAVAGVPRRAADTPEELLERAVGDGAVRTPAARRLTGLFREARFSRHDLADAQRHDASAALDEISGDLAGEP